MESIRLNLDTDFIVGIDYLKREYGVKFEKLNGFHNSNLNFTDFINNFTEHSTMADTTIDGNANVRTKDICSLTAEIDKPHMKLLAYNKIHYELKKQYGLDVADRWLEEEWNGGMYLHDASSSTFKPYCFAYDLKDLVEKGLFFVNEFKSEAPKHLMTYVRDVLEFVSWNSNRTSGACGLPSFLIYSYYFWKNDVENGYFLKNPEYYRDQSFQEIIYGLNQPYLRVNQSAFTNFTIMDRYYLEEMFGDRYFPNGELVINHIDELIEYQKAFINMVHKIRQEAMFTFPVLTYSLLTENGKFKDEEFARWCSDVNMKWCDSNFFMSDDITSLSSCCRLINDFSKLEGFINSIGGTSLKIGSVKVNTINLVRIALETKTETEYFIKLKEKVTLCLQVLDVIRGIIRRNIEKGLLPNYTHGLIELERQYNTIGINGMYETVEYLGLIGTDIFGNKSYSEKGFEFAKQSLTIINEIKDNFTKEYSINVECVPAERCAVILHQKDMLLYNVFKNKPMYSNQWIPLTEKCTFDEKLRLGSVLDKMCGGGQISHINIATDFKDSEQCWKVLNKIANSGIMYFAYNKKIYTCKHGHGFTEENCPKCGEPAEDVFTRIVGFLTPTKAYSKERKVEFLDRKWFEYIE